jgi:hypothetical protein
VQRHSPRREAARSVGVVTARKAPTVVRVVRVVWAVITSRTRVVRRAPGAVNDEHVIVPVVIIVIMAIVIVVIIMVVVIVIMVIVIVRVGGLAGSRAW